MRRAKEPCPRRARHLRYSRRPVRTDWPTLMERKPPAVEAGVAVGSCGMRKLCLCSAQGVTQCRRIARLAFVLLDRGCVSSSSSSMARHGEETTRLVQNRFEACASSTHVHPFAAGIASNKKSIATANRHRETGSRIATTRKGAAVGGSPCFHARCVEAMATSCAPAAQQ